MTTLTDPGYNLPSTPAGMMSPVPISVIGTTGTLVFAATLNAPFYKTEREEIYRSQLSCSLQPLSKSVSGPHVIREDGHQNSFVREIENKK